MQNDISKEFLSKKYLAITKAIEILSDLTFKKITVDNLVELSLNNDMLIEFRSIKWRIFLNILPILKINSWYEITQASREAYRMLHSKYINQDITSFFLNQKSIESMKYEKNELYNIELIKLDVSRTFQEIDLFRNMKTIESLSEILYIWTKENEDIKYIQGMNDILGTIYYALFPSIIHEMNIEMNKLDVKLLKDLYLYLNFEEYFDADLYFIFNNLMKRCLKNQFNYSNNLCITNSNDCSIINNSSLTLKKLSELTNITYIKKRILRIFNCYLKMVDPELFNYLNKFLEPEIFMFRWLLLLLNREVGLNECLYFWDTIFAMELYNSKTEVTSLIIMNRELYFLDFICVALLVNLKKTILSTDDQSYILYLLMNYPQDFTAREIINSAIKIRIRIMTLLN